MTVYPQNYNNQHDAPEYEEYDLNSEKQRIAAGTEEIKKELQEKWQKRYANAQIFPAALVNMNHNLIDFLLSFQHTLFYNELAKKFSLSQEQRDALPQIVWNLCKNKNWADLSSLLQAKLNLDQIISNQISQLVNNQILSKAKGLPTAMRPATNQNNTVNLRTTNVANTIDLSLSDALKAYTEIGEQLITSDRINIKNFPEPARPSVKNWLADYTFNLGHGTHSSIERGNYIFHTPNTQRLSSADREKLAYLLKSFDENTLITVDKNTKQIIFNSSQSTVGSSRNTYDNSKVQPLSAPETPLRLNLSEQPPKPSFKQPEPSINKISYSSPQKLPYERVQPSKPQPYRITPIFGKQPNPANKEIEKKPDERILGKNVVNLKDI